MASPNPFGGTLNLYFNTLQSENVTVSVFDVDGRLLQNVFKGKTNPNTPQNCQLNANELPNGLYIVRMTTENGMMVQQKIVLMR
ncbi:MAG: T9SS type A sorting domain-containing protein [Chitinophagales bacterium]|nr:T9SS type A sorting domain-containing protein [Chitinophagales bacterium]